jgi:hypothetical protein
MAIAFNCPNCQQPYKVKDDMAGKKVVCTSCKKQLRVPAPVAAPAVPHAEADALAAAALADAPAAPAETAAASITVECPNCIEQVTFPADKAGKQAPCPSCKRVIRVPVPATGKTDWRTADARPTFAKIAPEAELKGVVSTANIKFVDREALAEAGALRQRERQPLPLRTKITRGLVAACIVVLIGAGAMLFRGKKINDRRDHLVKQALELVKNPATPSGVRGETYRAAGEYVLAQPDGQAKTAREHLTNACGAIRDVKASEQPFEKTALLGRIAVTQAGLPGDRSEQKTGGKIEWDPAIKEMRYTLQALGGDPSQWEGTVIAVRDLTRALGLRGATPDQPAIVTLVTQRFTTPTEKADALAAVGLELLGDDAGKKKAETIADLARRAVGQSDAAGLPRLVALHVALNLALDGVKEPRANDSPAIGIRAGYAEGLARRGDLEAARNIAKLPGSPEDRFQALVAIAAIQPDAGLTDAVTFFAEEFKDRDLPDWSLIQLARLCATAKSPGPADSLNSALKGLSKLSPRSVAVRAWAQMELLGAPGIPMSEVSVREITPETALGHLLAWERFARATTPVNVDNYPEPARPLALVGSALGSLK